MQDKNRHAHRRGQWQVQRERHHIARPSPPPPFRESRDIHDLIPALMKRLGLDELHWQQELQSEWPQIVGKDVAAHSRPGRYQHGSLYVFVDSAVWLNELKRYAGKRISKTIQERFGQDLVKRVYFVPDPDRGRSKR